MLWWMSKVKNGGESGDNVDGGVVEGLMGHDSLPFWDLGRLKIFSVMLQNLRLFGELKVKILNSAWLVILTLQQVQN